MDVKTDRELLRRLGLSEPHVASLLGKTRQAVHAGLGDAVYLRDNEMTVLLNYTRVHNRAQVLAFEQYVSRSRPPESAAQIISSHGMFLHADDVLAAEELWAILPDYRYFKATHPRQLSILIDRAFDHVHTFVVITAALRDAELFWDDCGVSDETMRSDLSETVLEADVLPYCLVLEPASLRPFGWALVTGGFQRIDEIRTEGMRAFLKTRFDPLKVERRGAKAKANPRVPPSP